MLVQKWTVPYFLLVALVLAMMAPLVPRLIWESPENSAAELIAAKIDAAFAVNSGVGGLTSVEQDRLKNSVNATAIYMSGLSSSCLQEPFLKTALRDHLNWKFLGVRLTKDSQYNNSLKDLEKKCGKFSKMTGDIDKLLGGVGELIKKLGQSGVEWIISILLG